MTTTTHVASIDKIIDAASVRAAVIAMAGAPDQMRALEAEADYRDYLDSLLPPGYTIHGDEIYRDTSYKQMDLEDIRRHIREEDFTDDGGFDISEYIQDQRAASADDANPDDDLRASHDEARDVAQKVFNIARGMVTRARRLADRGNASSYRAASEVMQSANHTYRSAGSTFRWLEDDKNANLCAGLADITSGLSEGYENVANELDNVNGLLARLEP